MATFTRCCRAIFHVNGSEKQWEWGQGYLFFFPRVDIVDGHLKTDVDVVVRCISELEIVCIAFEIMKFSIHLLQGFVVDRQQNHVQPLESSGTAPLVAVHTKFCIFCRH